MDLRGKIVVALPLQTGEGRNGIWRKQEYVLEYNNESQYPKRMMFNLWGEKIDQFKLQEGQWVKVDFDIDCREYQGRWYNDVRAWRIESITDSAPMSAPASMPAAAPIPEMPSITSYSEQDILSPENSDLPF